MPASLSAPALRDLVAERFKALAEPARLHLLHALREKELTVGELVRRTGFGQANVSKHLRLLHALGLVSRRKEGLFVHYRLPDQGVFELCEIMCGRLESELSNRKSALHSPASASAPREARTVRRRA